MLLWQRTGEWRQVQQLLMDAILREAVKLRAYFSPSHAHPVSLAWSAKLPCNHLSTPGSLVYVDFKFKNRIPFAEIFKLCHLWQFPNQAQRAEWRNNLLQRLWLQVALSYFDQYQVLKLFLDMLFYVALQLHLKRPALLQLVSTSFIYLHGMPFKF